MLFNEPKLLKLNVALDVQTPAYGFSALQRAEIAEIVTAQSTWYDEKVGFSALQRAEIAEIERDVRWAILDGKFQCSSTSRNC